MGGWREHFERARELMASEDAAGAERELSAALESMPVQEGPEDRAAVQNNLGHARRMLGEMELALGCFAEAARLYGAAGELAGKAAQHMNMGSVYRDTGHPDQALAAYLDSLMLYEACGDAGGMADQYANLGFIYVQLQDEVRGLEAFTRARELYEESGDSEKAALVQQNVENLSR